MFKKQVEYVQQMSRRELVLQVYLTQLFLAIIALVLALFFYNSFDQFFMYWQNDLSEVLIIGGVSGLIVVGVDLAVMKWAPEAWYDDGGINQKIFTGLSIRQIFLMTLVIAVCEELLFRAVLQVHIGYVGASLIFALLHIRYLQKILLFSVVVALSFLLGWLFIVTENMFVPIFTHFFIDFTVGLVIRRRYLLYEEQ